jgi:hypothetical protein
MHQAGHVFLKKADVAPGLVAPAALNLSCKLLKSTVTLSHYILANFLSALSFCHPNGR